MLPQTFCTWIIRIVNVSLEQEKLDNRQNNEGQSRDLVNLFPFACFLYAFLVGIHILAGVAHASEIFAHSARVMGGNRLAGIPGLVLSIPIMLIWGAAWAFLCRRVSAPRFWTVFIVVVTLSWNIAFFAGDRWSIGIGLIVCQSIGAMGMGYSSYSRPTNNIGISASRRSATFVTLGTLVLCIYAIWLQSVDTGGTDFGILAMFWVLIILPLLLLSSYVFGYGLSQIWTDQRELRDNGSIFTPWMPIIALIPAILGIHLFLDNTISQFKRTVLPKFIGYIDLQLIRMPAQADTSVGFVGENLMNVLYRHTGSDGVSRTFEAIIPTNWTAAHGLRSPVELRSIECIMKGQTSHALTNSASVQALLKAVGAKDAVSKAKWKLGPRDLWLNPVTNKYDPLYPSWLTELNVGGLSTTISLFSGGRVLVESSREYYSFDIFRSSSGYLDTNITFGNR